MLKSTTRIAFAKQNKQLRLDNKLPGTVYGPGFESINITVDAKELNTLHKSTGLVKVFELDVDGTIHNVVIKKVQIHPVTHNVVDVEFYKINENIKMNVKIPCRIQGISMAVKNNIGFLVNPVNTISVRCLPSNLISELVIDISSLNSVGQSILIKDIALPAGVELQPGVDSYISVATIVPPQKIVEDKAVVTEGEGEVDTSAKPAGEGDKKAEA